jgi:hypothetical protein
LVEGSQPEADPPHPEDEKSGGKSFWAYLVKY